MANLMEEKLLYGSLTVYRERGQYLRRLEQFDKSIAAYDEAYRSVADGANVRMLLGRSQACGDAVKPHQAYADAEHALQLETDNMTARNLQARAMYTMSDFERSLVINYRGARCRKKPPYFREGINQGLETIQDCIGENAGSVMLDFLPLIRQMEGERLDDDGPTRVMRVSRIPQEEDKKRLTQMEARQHDTLARVMAMKYLGPMAYDKFFLQDLLEDPRLPSANAAGAAQLRSLIEETLNSLGERQEMMRSQRPYYNIKLAEKSQSSYQTKFKAAMLKNEREVGTRIAERLIRSIDRCVRSHKVNKVIEQAERMQKFLDKKTPRTLPDKEYYTDRLYRDVGEAYLSQHRLSYTLNERGNRRRIAFLMGLPVGRPQSYDSVIAHYPFKFIDVKEATKRVAVNLEMCENSLMKCWLNYEMARLLCAQKNFALGKFYAKRCQREAQKVGSPTWWLNGCFVLMSGDMQQGNTNEVRVLVEEAYEWAKHSPDSMRVLPFLEKCAEMASETMSIDERKAIVQREQQIMHVLPPDMQSETEVLLKRMSTVPEGRRFSVLPGKERTTLDTTSERHRRRQKGLTVVPGPVQALPAPPRTLIPGLQIFDN